METLATEEDCMECHNSLLTSISEKEQHLKTLMKKELCILYSCYGLKYKARSQYQVQTNTLFFDVQLYLSLKTTHVIKIW